MLGALGLKNYKRNAECSTEELRQRYASLPIECASVLNSSLRRNANYEVKQQNHVDDSAAVAAGDFTVKQFNRVRTARFLFCLHVCTRRLTRLWQHLHIKRSSSTSVPLICDTSPRRHVAQHEAIRPRGLRRSALCCFAFCLPCFVTLCQHVPEFFKRGLNCIDACNLGVL